MILNKGTTDFLEMLKSRPEVLGVILFGSWARGNNRPDSDVDLLIIVTEGFRRTVEYNGSQAFEIIYTTEQEVLGYWQHHTDDCAGLWAVAKVLYDREGAVLRLQLGAAQLLGKGKKAIDAFQLGQFRFDADDSLKAVGHLMQTDPIAASFVLTNKVFLLTKLFFDIRQQWTPAPKQRLAAIKAAAPALYDLLARFYADEASLGEKIALAGQMVPLVFKG